MSVKTKATPRARDPKRALIFWNVPLPLRKRFKTKCAAEGRTMQAVVCELLEDYAGRSREPKK